MKIPSISSSISNRPLLFLALIFILTGFFGGAFLLQGIEMEATENTFMPENELVNASEEIGEKFGSTQGVQVIVKADSGNVLIPESLVEVVEVQEAISNNEDVNVLLIGESDPRRISSVPNNLIQGKNLLNTINGMKDALVPQFSEINSSLSQLNQVLRESRMRVQNSLGTKELPEAIILANRSIMQTAMELISLYSGGAPGHGGGSRNGNSGSLNHSEKVKFFQNMTKPELVDLVKRVMEYDESRTDPMVDVVESAISTSNETSKEINALNQTLKKAASDPNLAGNISALGAMGMLRFIITPMDDGISQLKGAAEEINIDVTTKQLNSGVKGIKNGIRFLLTVDFQPSDGNYTANAMMISFNFNSSKAQTAGDDKEVLLRAEEAMQETIDEMDLSFSEMVVTAQELTSREILTATRDSLKILLPLAFALVIFVLALVYRNLTDMIISIVGLGLAVIWTYGLGVLFGFVFNPMTLAVPVVIVGLGIDYGIHLTMRYREERSGGRSPADSSQISITWVGSALLIATITSVMAFMSNLTSDLSALQEFGILCATGIISAFVVMLVFVPSLKQLIDRRSKARSEGKSLGQFSVISGVLGTGATAAEKHPKAVILLTLMVTLGALYGATNLNTRFEIEDFLPKNLEYSQNLRYIMDNFNISGASASILIEGNLTNPEFLEAMEASTLDMMDDQFVSRMATPEGERPQVQSILSLMKDVAKDNRIADPLDLYNQNFSSMFWSSIDDNDDVPDHNLGELLNWLYYNDNTKSLARSLVHRNENGIFNAAVMSISVESDRREDAAVLKRELEQDATPLQELVDGKRLDRVSITGSTIMLKEITESMESSMTLSFILTLILSFIALTIIFALKDDSVALGAITMIPVLLCSAWILGTMYLLGIPYTMLTITVSALTIGLGVTYGIHLTHRFVEEVDAGGDVDEGCRKAVTQTGSALFGAAATTISGFGLLGFSLLPPLQEFGGIVALTIAFSFLATVFVLPTFLVLWAKRYR